MTLKISPAFFVVALLLAFTSCKKELKQRVASKDELYAYLDSLEKRYETACSQVQISDWSRYSKDGSSDAVAARGRLAEIFRDTTALNIIEEWRSRSASLADKMLARRLELWHRCFLGGAIYADQEIESLKNSLAQKYFNLKFTIDGKQYTPQTLIPALREEKKRTRRRNLWITASQFTASVTTDYLNLVKAYNTKAQTLGFPNYYSLRLYLEAIDEMWLYKTMASLETFTRPDYEKLTASAKKKLRMKDFTPWDIDFVQHNTVSLPDKYFPADSALTIIHRFEKGIGFNLDSLPISITSVNSGQRGMCFSVNIPKDLRAIIPQGKGVGFYRAGLDGYGHGLMAAHTKVDYPILKGYATIPGTSTTAYDYGVAQMHGDYTGDSLWISRFTKVKEKDLRQYLLKRNNTALFRMRSMLADFFTEYEIYKNPNWNLDSLAQSISNKYLFFTDDRKTMFTFSPSIQNIENACGNHSAILREMISAQLHEALASKFGNEKISNPDVSKWMIEYLYMPAESIEWYERIRNATGKYLEPGAYLRKLNVEQTTFITTETKQ